jgi:hypothetical protein
MSLPQLGTGVWFHPATEDSFERLGDEPLAGIVAHVNADSLNLAVFDAVGAMSPITRQVKVPFVAAGEKPPAGAWCELPPAPTPPA